MSGIEKLASSSVKPCDMCLKYPRVLSSVPRTPQSSWSLCPARHILASSVPASSNSDCCQYLELKVRAQLHKRSWCLYAGSDESKKIQSNSDWYRLQYTLNLTHLYHKQAVIIIQDFIRGGIMGQKSQRQNVPSHVMWVVENKHSIMILDVTALF